MYKLITNSGTFYVQGKPTNEQERRYIRAMMDRGLPFSSVVFTYVPIRVGTVEGIVQLVEKKANMALENKE